MTSSWLSCNELKLWCKYEELIQEKQLIPRMINGDILYHVQNILALINCLEKTLPCFLCEYFLLLVIFHSCLGLNHCCIRKVCFLFSLKAVRNFLKSQSTSSTEMLFLLKLCKTDEYFVKLFFFVSFFPDKSS